MIPLYTYSICWWVIFRDLILPKAAGRYASQVFRSFHRTLLRYQWFQGTGFFHGIPNLSTKKPLAKVWNSKKTPKKRKVLWQKYLVGKNSTQIVDGDLHPFVGKWRFWRTSISYPSYNESLFSGTWIFTSSGVKLSLKPWNVMEKGVNGVVDFTQVISLQLYTNCFLLKAIPTVHQM